MYSDFYNLDPEEEKSTMIINANLRIDDLSEHCTIKKTSRGNSPVIAIKFRRLYFLEDFADLIDDTFFGSRGEEVAVYLGG